MDARLKSPGAIRIARAFLWVCSLVAFAALAINSPISGLDPLLLFMATILAVSAELIPVHYEREGVRLAFSLPFVVSGLILTGPLGAVFVEITTLLAVLVFDLLGRKRKALYWASLNVPISLLSVSVAGGVYAGMPPAVDMLGMTLKMTTFTLTYLGLNASIVLSVNQVLMGRRDEARVRSVVAATTLVSIATVLAGFCVVVFALERQPSWVPTLLIPILLLRRCLLSLKLLDDLSYETLVALTIMLQRAHPYTHGHLERVGRIAESVGRKLGLSRHRSRLLREAAVLHDIGKIAVDEMVLNKPGKLTPDEYAHVKKHSDFGAEILRRSPRYSALVPWIHHHHERPDGNGYPDRLTDREIPIESKIIAVADAFDAMVGDEESGEQRNYRTPKTVSEALVELQEHCGTQFDSRVVNAFCDVLGQEGGTR